VSLYGISHSIILYEHAGWHNAPFGTFGSQSRGTEGCQDKRKYYKPSQSLLILKCSFSFAHPKENEPKEKGALKNGPDKNVGNVPFHIKEAILIYGGSYLSEEIPKIAFVIFRKFLQKGTGLHF